MSENAELGKLDQESWDRLQDVLERFEKDCSASFPRLLRDYVPAPDDKLRGIILEELVRTDLELRWRKRQGVLVEFYLKDFPELMSSRFLPRLLRDERNIRLQHASPPDMVEYQQRFPDHYVEFSRLTAESAPSSETEKPNTARSDFVVPVQKDVISDTMSGVFAMAARFKRVRKIGEGAFGEVWQAEAPGGVPVAIKRIFGAVTTKAVERERESLDLICSGKLRHPFLLQVFGWWINNERLHIMMELADESLDDRLKAAMGVGAPGLQISAISRVLVDAADALDFLNHERNIVHRDVKPANMLLMANRLKLCDFGLSRMSENLDLFMGRTRGAGTPVFMAPEIIRGYQSAQSDQYSLACSYYMLRTGRAVFQGKVAEIRRQHLEAAPELNEGILKPQEKTVLLKALSKNTAERFPTCTEFICDLLAAADGQPLPVTPPPSPDNATQQSKSPPSADASSGSDQAAAPIGQSTPPKEFDKSGAPLSAGESDVPMTIQHAPLGESTRSRRRWEPLRTASSSSFPKVAPQTVSKKSAGAFWKTILVLAVAGVIAAAAVVFFLMGE